MTPKCTREREAPFDCKCERRITPKDFEVNSGPMNNGQKCGQIIANLSNKERLDEEWYYYYYHYCCGWWYHQTIYDTNWLLELLNVKEIVDLLHSITPNYCFNHYYYHYILSA
ncbi:hypothetical protein LOAG_06751 [Loa loa]|uniref:Uncharacterized protein n=1 Tax=Loa loa TaxID=7209 RepID=A0A1S0TX70_LOALO|nr:hypothetical protein LOAG_06751 [Loa loa]EFO21736.1 hypothetical protein LOAG_06751 [Loa loa]